VLRKRGIANSVAVAIIVVVVALSGTFAAYSVAQRGTVTQTSVQTLTTISTVSSTVTAPPVTETNTYTTTAPPSTVTSTATATSTVAATTVTKTTIVTGTIVVSTVTTTVTGSQSSSSPTTTTTSTASTSCESTTTSTTNSTSTTQSSTELGQEMLTLVGHLPQMSLTYGENTTNGPILLNESYALGYGPISGPGTYKISFYQSYDGFSQTTNVWLLSNGTLLAANNGGGNDTGADAQNDFVVASAPFTLVGAFGSNPSSVAPASDIYEASNSTIVLGKVSMNVTNFRADTLPLNYDQCPDSFSLNTFVLQVGLVPSTKFDIITYLDFQGTAVIGGTSGPYSLLLKVTSITLP
jgi:hypothetical protein